MRLVKFLFEHKVALLIVALFFIAQSVCELMLPQFTASIVDIGIQQAGIEDALPESMLPETYDAICDSYADDAESRAAVTSAYELDDETGNWVLGIPEGVERADVAALVSPRLVALHFPGVELSPEFVQQQGIEAVKAEYRAQGIDLLDLQIGYLLRLSLLMILAVVLASGLHCCMNWFATRTACIIAKDLRTKLFERVVHFSDLEISRFSAASLITRGTNDITLIQNITLHMQRMFIGSACLAIGGVIMIAQTNGSMAWIVFLAVVLIVILVIVLFAITMPKFRIMQKLVDRVNLVAREILTGIPVIRAFGREKHEEGRFQTANTDLMATQLYTSRAMAFMMPGMMLVMNLTAVVIVWVGAQFVDAGTIQTGDIIAYITYSMVIIASFLMLGMVCVILPRAGVAADRVWEVCTTASSIADALQVYDCNLEEGPGASVEFRDVSFRYPDAEGYVLKNVSFKAEAGKTTAIIGSTGSGKSTVVKLIERFLDVTDGAVLVGGVDVRDLSLEKLHSTVGYVPQQAYLFTGTIGSNVAYGAPDASDEELIHALEIAQGAQFVLERDEGLDAPIAQGGTNLSGGQRQRVSIARALATEARVFVFDDSFSALDYKTDADLRAAMKEQLAGRTSIIVAQRIATIMYADRIIVLEDGRIVGQGTNAELMRDCPQYREIAYSQLSEEELAGGDR